jgi:hypothetical protein
VDVPEWCSLERIGRMFIRRIVIDIDVDIGVDIDIVLIQALDET